MKMKPCNVIKARISTTLRKSGIPRIFNNSPTPQQEKVTASNVWRNLTMGLVLLLLAASCIASKKPDINMRIEDNLLLFDHPPLALKIKAEVKSVEKEKSPRKVFFADEKASPLFIEFFKTSELNTLQFYSDLKYISQSYDLIYVGPAYFGDREWAKVMHADAEGFLAYGYLTLKDDHFLYIYMVDGLGPKKVQPFIKYQNTRRVPETAEEFIYSRFKLFNSYASIHY